MEVEKVQDGPLKKTEIIRFLEASKTSYRAVDTIITDRKETLFQQRTLNEIASEAEIRNNTSSFNPDMDSSSEKEVELADTTDNQALELEAKKVKEEEQQALKLLEEKKVEDEKLVEEEKEKAIYERGFAEGKAASDLDEKKALESGLSALENARKSILDLNASHFIKLRDQIAAQILNLSSERAGIEINNLPESFLNKIEALLETIGKTTQAPVVFLNSDDLKSIQTSIEAQNENHGFTFETRDGLMNGDIVVEFGSISISDTARGRSGVSNTDDLAKLDHETTESKAGPAIETNVADKPDLKKDS